MAMLVKNILERFLNPHNNWRKKLFKDWSLIVGDLDDRMCLCKVYQDTVVIGVYETCWMQELHALSRYIIKSINNHLEQNYIKNIRFQMVSPKQEAIIRKFRSFNHYTPPTITLNAQQKEALVSIKDAQLRKALTTFLACCIGKNG